MPVVEITQLREDAPLPYYANPGDAGADLASYFPVALEPGERALVPTGIAVAIPDGYVGLIHPRSGLAAKFGITVVNAPGTIDSGYRGEVKVALINLGPDPQLLPAHSRIAQLVIQPVARARFRLVDSLDETTRGDGGFGSTGLAPVGLEDQRVDHDLYAHVFDRDPFDFQD